jgi:hypothetical protein
MKLKLTLAAASILMAGLAIAQPSEYYVWKNKGSGQTVCWPEMPADKWIKLSGPYEDPNCKIRIPN